MPQQRLQFTLRQEQEIVERYRAGASPRTVAAALGCSSKPVLRVLHEHQVYEPRRLPRRLLSDSQKQEIATRYKVLGEHIDVIAKDYGCSASTVWHALRGLDAHRAPAGRVPKVTAETLELVRKLRTERGLSTREIADELGVRAVNVARWLRRLGLPADPRGSLRGPRATGWRGGTIQYQGYIGVKVDPADPMHVMAWKNGYVPEHRLVMARHLGRPLTRWETVHHKDNVDTTDNRIENLQLRQGNHGKGARCICLDCGSHNVASAEL